MIDTIKLKPVTIFLFFSIFLFACKKDNNNTVNGGYVNITINLNDPTAFQLNAVGGWIYISGVDAGLKGLIVYRRSLDEYAAYDRACTYDPNASCALVKVESSGVTAIDSCCGSKYEIYYGSVTHGPASQPLIQYKITRDGNYLYVSNL